MASADPLEVVLTSRQWCVHHTAGPSTLEFFHNTPSGDELAGCLIKHSEFRHFLLLLRLLGAGRVLKQAIAELKALDAGAPERTLALPILVKLRLEIPADPAKQTNDDQEFLMNTHDIVETWRRAAIQEGVEQGIEQGIARSLVRIYEARFGTMPEELRAVIEDTTMRLRSTPGSSSPGLVAWTRSPQPSTPLARADEADERRQVLMNTHDIVETWRREAIQEGVKQGIEQGIARSWCGFRPMAIAETGAWRSPKPEHGDHRNRAWRSPKPDIPITETGDGDRLRSVVRPMPDLR